MNTLLHNYLLIRSIYVKSIYYYSTFVCDDSSRDIGIGIDVIHLSVISPLLSLNK